MEPSQEIIDKRPGNDFFPSLFKLSWIHPMLIKVKGKNVNPERSHLMGNALMI